ncbi:hypothetical protein [Salisediminibacterium selenitireducens]|uniref:Uncharacterized protein n=1 Tax=Bacillus selenitireducens (strain ATCC 700615 / DSM 15326 / MLS10) TaxID=439292 RepID=D6Y143_BACIE|nr:hypothetical protein [Salisediminibacterium selenitireducens]ADH98647.1 hypothetical protein Bsel_1130 [[Bacillus] selenitireducens MLS10]
MLEFSLFDETDPELEAQGHLVRQVMKKCGVERADIVALERDGPDFFVMVEESRFVRMRLCSEPTEKTCYESASGCAETVGFVTRRQLEGDDYYKLKEK